MTNETIPSPSHLVTCHLFTKTHGTYFFRFQTTASLKEIAALWDEAWAKDKILHFDVCEDGYYRAIPAQEILRFEIKEGSHKVIAGQ